MFLTFLITISISIAPSSSKYTIHTTTTEPSLEESIETPEFLKNATDAQRKEFIELATNPNLPLDTKAKAMTNWAKRCGEPVDRLYDDYINEMTNLQIAEDIRMAEIVAGLSVEAQQADKSVREITSNMSQTRKEMDAKVAEKLEKLPKKVYYELTFSTQ